jgi:Rrf2 family nitric oxide-sensitive transcriptional repressor
MKLTQYTDYSLRVLMYLGMQKGQSVTISEIAARHQISRNHVMKVVYELGQLGYLKTTRGKNGGVQLGRTPTQINVGKLVRETEKNLEIVECFGPDDHCAITSACILKSALSTALRAFFDVLDGYTLKDLLAPEAKLQKLLLR